jgi:osomolarity two-component system response regulator SKN7
MKFYRRNSTQEDGASLGAESSATATHRDFSIQQQITPSGDHPASPLQAAQRLMSDFSSDQLKNGSLEYLSEMYNKQINGSLGTPPPEPGLPESDAAPAQRGGSGSNSSNTPAAYSRYMGGDLNDTVYPVGHIPPNSIDPMYQQQIPYPVPQNPGLEPTDPRRAFTTRKKSATLDPGWTRTPNILLVEDDPTCRRIGGKFLLSFKCAIDSAVGKPAPQYSYSNLPMLILSHSSMVSRLSTNSTTAPNTI